MHYSKKQHVISYYALTFSALLIGVCGMLMLKSFYTGGFSAAPSSGASKWFLAILVISAMIVSIEKARHKK